MMTVRFPGGLSLQYNEANYAVWGTGGFTDLYTKKDGTWLAQVPTAAALIEIEPASRVYSVVNESQLERLEKEMRLLKRAVNKLAK